MHTTDILVQTTFCQVPRPDLLFFVKTALDLQSSLRMFWINEMPSELADNL